MTLDELDKQFERIEKQFPNSRRELIEGAGEKLYSKVVRNIESDTKEYSGNLKNAAKKVIGSKGGYVAIRNKSRLAPHAHLVENGHKIVRNGRVIGWVAGKHMYRNALNELENELIQDAEEMVNRLVGDTFG